MNKLVGLIFLLSFLSCTNKKNEIIHEGGTYIMAAICKDGIVCGSDSRVVFMNRKNEVVGYFDGAKKIYEHNGVVLLMVGVNTFGNDRFYGLFQQFKSLHPEKIPIEQFFTIFKSFIRSRLTEADFNIFIKNEFAICGYSNSTPKIMYYQGQEIEVLTYGCKTSIDIKGKKFAYFDDFKNLDMNKADLLTKYLIDAIVSHQKGLTNIGGDASIINITRKSPKWMISQSIDTFATQSQLSRFLLSGKIKITYRSKEDSIDLHRMFEVQSKLPN